MNFSAHLTRLAQGTRDQLADLQDAPPPPQERIHSHAFPPYVTTQAYDTGQATEGSWMLGRGEEGQLNEDKACLLQNYWLRVDRDATQGQALFAGTLEGRLDLRMNGEDAVLYCRTLDTAAGTEFVTQLDFLHASFLIQKGTDESRLQSFQVSLEDPSQYLLSLARDEFIYWNVTLEGDNSTLALSQNETTGIVMTDATSLTSMQLRNTGAGAKVSLQGEAAIDIATADIGGNDCRFHEWTKDGQPASPPLYVLSSQAADLSALPCIFEWVKEENFLGIGTNADCTALQSLKVEMAYGFNLEAGDTTSHLQLDGGSGYFRVAVSPDENVSAVWQMGSAFVNVGLGTSADGITIDYGTGLTVALQSGPPSTFGDGHHAIQFREIDVCDNGTPKKMVVLASAPYDAS